MSGTKTPNLLIFLFPCPPLMAGNEGVSGTSVPVSLCFGHEELKDSCSLQPKQVLHPALLMCFRIWISLITYNASTPLQDLMHLMMKNSLLLVLSGGKTAAFYVGTSRTWAQGPFCSVLLGIGGSPGGKSSHYSHLSPLHAGYRKS